MSRQPIPSSARWGDHRALRQLGLIAFRRAFLEQFARLSPTPLERAESVDMLRAIEHGFPVQIIVSPHESFGVDTPADLQAAEARLAADTLAAELFSATAPSTRS
jgi:3-deoxy-manno-octulosonate cytidylyltransferase (CMP-KDO synthetase)